MLEVDLYWDEYGRGVVLRHDDARGRRSWPIRLYRLGSACVEEQRLTADLVTQLAMFGSAELGAQDESVIVPELKAA